MKRFSVTVSLLGCLILLFAVFYATQILYTAFYSAQGEAAFKEDGFKKAESAVMHNRVEQRRYIEDLITLFPDRLESGADCYQAASANYVETQWNRIAKETGCDSSVKLCDPTADFKKILNSFSPSIIGLNPYGLSAEMKSNIIKVNNTWFIAAEFYKLIDNVLPVFAPYEEIDSFRAPASPEDTKFLQEHPGSKYKPMPPEEITAQTDMLKNNLASCATWTPPLWSRIDQPFSYSGTSMTEYAIKLGIGSLVTNAIMASQLTKEDRGYVGCLHTLLRAEYSQTDCPDHQTCAANIRADNRNILTSQLEGLKAHQCSPVYAFELFKPAPNVSKP